MTATATKPPRSRAEILADPTMTPWQRAQEISALSKWEQKNPPVPEPVILTPVQRTQLENLRSQLTAAKDRLIQLDETEKAYADARPDLERKITDLKTNLSKDALTASPNSLLDYRAEIDRLDMVRGFLFNVQNERDAIGKTIIGMFHQFNGIVEKIGGQKIYPGGTRLDKNCEDAITVIGKILNV